MNKYRKIAADWHGGQWSSLYSFASTGTIVPGLEREIESILKNKIDQKERNNLNKLLKFVRHELEFDRRMNLIRQYTLYR